MMSFNSQKVIIRNKELRKLLLEGQPSDGLYRLPLREHVPNGDSVLSVEQGSMDRWHNNLAHLNHTSIKNLAHNKQICVSKPTLGKHVCEPLFCENHTNHHITVVRWLIFILLAHACLKIKILIPLKLLPQIIITHSSGRAEEDNKLTSYMNWFGSAPSGCTPVSNRQLD